MELRHLQARRGGLRAAGRILVGVEPLRDAHGRTINDLRVSVTDRCNFRCRYCMPAEGMRWLDRADLLSFEEIAAPGRGARRARDHRRPADRRRAAGAPRLPAAGRDAAPDRGHRDLSLTTNGYLLERDAGGPGRRGDRPRQRLDRLARARPLPRDHPPRRAAAGAARARGDRRATSACARSRSTRWRCATSPRTRSIALRRARPLDRLPGPLHRVHAARRRPRLEPRPGPDRRGAPGADRRDLPARGAAARAARDRAGLPLRRRRAARSASSTRSPSRSAPTATGSG